MYIYKSSEIRKTDEKATAQGLSLLSLMENSGKALYDAMSHVIDPSQKIIVLAGPGNNGGDGIVLARYLKQHHYQVDLVFPLQEPQTDVSKQHYNYYLKQGYQAVSWQKHKRYDVVIDGLLGIGTIKPLSSEVKKILTWANHLEGLKLSIDLPTGVLADLGNVSEAFQADQTYVLHGPKPSAFLVPSQSYYGELHQVSIGLNQSSKVKISSYEAVRESFPSRESTSHKGTFGTSLLVAGSDLMPGSALLGAIGAIRSGVGKLTLATPVSAVPIITSRVPEAIYLQDGLSRIAQGEFNKDIASAGIGPGITNQTLCKQGLEQLVTCNIPIVVDAGALDSSVNYLDLSRSSESTLVLTPHPGEFSRLTGLSINEIQANRIELAKRYAKENEVILVLKGHRTVIAYPDGETFINPTGNSGLSKGGSGDVLTGMLVSMLSTHQDVKSAVINAVYIHGLAADYWSETKAETSMVASDFERILPKILKQFED